VELELLHRVDGKLDEQAAPLAAVLLERRRVVGEGFEGRERRLVRALPGERGGANVGGEASRGGAT